MIYGGTDIRGFYAAAGWGVVVIATFPWLVWVLIASILLLRKREAGASTWVHRGADGGLVER